MSHVHKLQGLETRAPKLQSLQEKTEDDLFIGKLWDRAYACQRILAQPILMGSNIVSTGIQAVCLIINTKNTEYAFLSWTRNRSQ